MITALTFIFKGINYQTVNGDCYERAKYCHGLPINGCLGVSTEEVDLESENQCEYSEDIKERCNQLGEKICQNGSSNDWGKNAYVRNIQCSSWMSEYDFEVKACN